MSDITQMTSAELVEKRKDAKTVIDARDSVSVPVFNKAIDNYLGIGHELDRRCTDAGIFSNGDGTFKSEPRFNMTVKEANEWLALSKYMISKNER